MLLRPTLEDERSLNPIFDMRDDSIGHLGTKGELRPSLSLNESLHDRLHHDPDDQKIEQFQTFHTAWVGSCLP